MCSACVDMYVAGMHQFACHAVSDEERKDMQACMVKFLTMECALMASAWLEQLHAAISIW